MPSFDRRKFLWLAAGMMAVMAAVFLIYRSSNTPAPTRQTHPIKAGGVAKAFVTPKRSGNRSLRNPHHLEYDSAAGAVDVYVVRCTIGYRAAEREQIDKLTDEFAAGHAPKDFVAKSSGERGRIDLGGWFQSRHEGSYLVLIRSAKESEVTIVVHYGP